MDERVKVAVLGGGCGGLAAACTLTATPELRARFDVTVYEQGWRLGGKGASGRMPHGAEGQRIEEHGLHIWFGFYERAFQMLRQAYEEAGIASGEQWWQTAFDKCHGVSLYDHLGDGDWIRQGVTLPARGGSDAGPPSSLDRPGLAKATARTIKMLALGLRTELSSGGPTRGVGDDPGDPTFAETVDTLDQLAAELDQLPDDGDFVARRGVMDAIGGTGRLELGALQKLVDRLQALATDVLAQVPRMADKMRLWGGVLDMVGATLTGIVKDGLLMKGLATIDDLDLREWLVKHGADQETVSTTPVLRGLYDLAFAYQDGDKTKPSMAAGKGVQSLLMMVNYDGAFMWRMRAGMGDVVFGPLYLALRKRGVNFEYFSQVTALHLSPDKSAIDEIEVRRSATVEKGCYEPLERVGNWECWPGEPLGGQLSKAALPQTQTLTRGQDYHQVVLAIPVGAQHEICSELVAASPRYKEMLDGSHTVRTKAMQLWLTKTIDELRTSPDGRLDPPATAYAEPFDTYCDMSHLLPVEGHGDGGPKGVAYFCAVMLEEASEAEALAFVEDAGLKHIQAHAQAFWPGAFKDGEFDWDVLFDPEDRVGPERMKAQYVRANTDGSERYVTTPAGSTAARLEPGDSGFSNLVLAGDWTHNDIDGGCVEAAVISGERAGEALIGGAR